MNTPHLSFRDVESRMRYGSVIRPERDWLVLLSVCGVLLLASIAWNLLLFNDVTNGKAIGSATTTPASAEPSISGVESLFTARAAEQTKYESTYRFVDPSL